MIDERFVYDFVTVFCYVFAIYRLFFRKPEESFFAFFDECIDPKCTERRAHWQQLLIMSGVLCVLLWAETGEGSQMPAMIQEAHHTVEGRIVDLEAWEKNKRGYEIFPGKTYRLTIRETNGNELFLEETRAPELQKGMDVEVRLYEANNLVPLITRVNGRPTPLFLSDYPVTVLERMMVFASYVLMAVLMFLSLRRQYVVIGGRALGKKWYACGWMSVVLWIGIAWGCIFGKQYHAGSGTILYTVYTWIHLCIFILTWVVNPEGAERLTGILFGKKRRRKLAPNEVIPFVRCSEADTNRYCRYKKKRLRVDLFEWVVLELGALAIAGAIDILWENDWKEFVILCIFVLVVLTFVWKIRRTYPDYMALRMGSTSGMEWAVVPFSYRKKRTYRGTDGAYIESVMLFDEEVDLDEGELAVVIRIVGTPQTFIERKVVMQEKILGRQELFW